MQTTFDGSRMKPYIILYSDLNSDAAHIQDPNAITAMLFSSSTSTIRANAIPSDVVSAFSGRYAGWEGFVFWMPDLANMSNYQYSGWLTPFYIFVGDPAQQMVLTAPPLNVDPAYADVLSTTVSVRAVDTVNLQQRQVFTARKWTTTTFSIGLQPFTSRVLAGTPNPVFFVDTTTSPSQFLQFVGFQNSRVSVFGDGTKQLVVYPLDQFICTTSNKTPCGGRILQCGALSPETSLGICPPPSSATANHAASSNNFELSDLKKRKRNARKIRANLVTAPNTPLWMAQSQQLKVNPNHPPPPPPRIPPAAKSKDSSAEQQQHDHPVEGMGEEDNNADNAKKKKMQEEERRRWMRLGISIGCLLLFGGFVIYSVRQQRRRHDEKNEKKLQ